VIRFHQLWELIYRLPRGWQPERSGHADKERLSRHRDWNGDPSVDQLCDARFSVPISFGH